MAAHATHTFSAHRSLPRWRPLCKRDGGRRLCCRMVAWWRSIRACSVRPRFGAAAFLLRHISRATITASETGEPPRPV
eukprot:5415615-Pyramimonas_sp.AAC.1